MSASGKTVTLADVGGTTSRLVDALHDMTAHLADLPTALVGGLAVLVHVGRHRVTEDIDSAVLGLRDRIDTSLAVIAHRLPGRDPRYQTTDGVVIDVLLAKDRPPRAGTGARQAARAHALLWAITTAEPRRLTTTPPSTHGPVDLRVATRAALVALKLAAADDPRRGDKRATDLLDIWRLLADNPATGEALCDNLASAPGNIPAYAADQLRSLFNDDASACLRDMAGGLGRPTTSAQLRDYWQAIIAPSLDT